MEDIERLMDKGLPVDVRDQYGNTLLTIACQNGYVRGVEVESSSLLIELIELITPLIFSSFECVDV